MTKLTITRPLNQATKQLIVDAAKAYFDKHKGVNGFTMETFYRGETITKSDWSYMRNGKWDEVATTRNGKETFSSIKDEKFLRLGAAIGIEFANDYWQHIDTDNFALIVNILDKARVTKIPYAIDGDTGLGKTYAISAYKKMMPGETFVITCAGDMSIRDFFIELAKMFGIKGRKGLSRFSLRQAVALELQKYSDPILVVDEAENLKPKVYDGVKALMDDLKGSCGMILIGANNYEEMLAKKAENFNSCFPQVYSRLKEGGFHKLFKMSLVDVKTVCSKMNITDKDVVKMLAAYANNMRELSGIVRELLHEAEEQNCPVDVELLKTIL